MEIGNLTIDSFIKISMHCYLGQASQTVGVGLGLEVIFRSVYDSMKKYNCRNYRIVNILCSYFKC